MAQEYRPVDSQDTVTTPGLNWCSNRCLKRDFIFLFFSKKREKESHVFERLVFKRDWTTFSKKN
jgi:hypothetical protein